LGQRSKATSQPFQATKTPLVTVALSLVVLLIWILVIYKLFVD